MTNQAASHVDPSISSGTSPTKYELSLPAAHSWRDLTRFVNRYNLHGLEDIVLTATGVCAVRSAVLAFREKSVTLAEVLTIVWAIILFAYGVGAVLSMGQHADESPDSILSFDA